MIRTIKIHLKDKKLKNDIVEKVYQYRHFENMYIILLQQDYNQKGVNMLQRYIEAVAVFTIFILFSPLLCAEWTPMQNGEEDELHAVCFADNSNGWLIGTKGLIKHTYNGGMSWTTQNSGTSNDLNDLYFVNALVGWIVGDNGTILYTNNAGVTWIPLHTEVSSSLRGICFTNPNEGWIVGDFGIILHTVDSGKTWIEQYSGNSVTLEDVHFVDSKNGWAVGLNGTVLHTTNGGNSWQAQVSGVSDFLYGVYFCNQKEGWVVGDNGTILHTSDGGAVWNKNTANISYRLRKVYFADLNQGWVVGDSGVILHTMNSGETWETETSRGHISFYDISHGGTNIWIVGSKGTILRNSDALTAQTIRLNKDVGTDFVLPHETTISTGRLSIDSKPRGAKIYLNGKLLEYRTPATVKDLIPGRYEIKVVKRNYGTTRKYVYVSENEATSEMLKMPKRSIQISIFTAIIVIGGITIGAVSAL